MMGIKDFQSMVLGEEERIGTMPSMALDWTIRPR
jgi:hypothetical protein